MDGRLTFHIIPMDGDLINPISHQLKYFKKSVFCNEITNLVKISFYLLKRIGMQESFVYEELLWLEMNGILEIYSRE